MKRLLSPQQRQAAILFRPALVTQKGPQRPRTSLQPCRGIQMAPKVYDANCHCGAIRYQVTLEEALSPEGATKVNRCNCSICTKNGYLLVYPKREDVRFLGDSEAKLKKYLFGQRRKPHLFCGECGCNVMIDFSASEFEKQRPFWGVNARLFKDIDLGELEYTTFDGWNRLEPQYVI